MRLLILLFVLLPTLALGGGWPLPGPVPGQGNAGDPAPVQTNIPMTMPAQVIPPKDWLRYDKVMFVFDVSGSMTDRALIESCMVAKAFASDGFRVAAIAFATYHVLWAPPPTLCRHKKEVRCGRKCVPLGWGLMPKHSKELFKFIQKTSAGGGTIPQGALLAALKNAPAGTLIVFVSDGLWDEHLKEVIRNVKKGFAYRKKKKLGDARILVWCTDDRVSDRRGMQALAKLGKGGLWIASSQRSGPW